MRATRALVGHFWATMSENALIAVIGDEDTITGFLLAGTGQVDLRKKTNFLLVNDKTPTKDVEDSFKSFTSREDIAIVLINQHCAELIRHLLDSYNKVSHPGSVNKLLSLQLLPLIAAVSSGVARRSWSPGKAGGEECQ